MPSPTMPAAPRGCAVVGAEVVLRKSSASSRQSPKKSVGHDAVAVGCAVEAVVDAAEVLPRMAVVRGGLAGVDELAALVEEVADRHRQVLLALGDREVRAGRRTTSRSTRPRVLGQAVVAEVPDDGLVVAEHAEVVRHALGVDVPEVRASACLAARAR